MGSKIEKKKLFSNLSLEPKKLPKILLGIFSEGSPNDEETAI